MRWSVSQSLFFVTFVALVIGLAGVAWESAHQGQPADVEFAPGDAYMAGVTGLSHGRSELNVWELDSGIPVPLHGLDALFKKRACSSFGFVDDHTLWTVIYNESNDSAEFPTEIVLYDLDSVSISSRLPLPCYPLEVQVLSALGTAAIFSERGLELFELSDGRPGAKLELPWNRKFVDKAVASSKRLVGSMGRAIVLWDPSTGTELGRASCNYVPDELLITRSEGKLCTISREKQRLTVWDLEPLRIRHEISIGPIKWQHSQDDEFVAIQGQKLLRLDTNQGEITRHDLDAAALSLLGVSSNGFTMALGEGKRLGLWNSESETPRFSHALIEDTTSRNVIVYTLGFAIWSWALGAYLQRRLLDDFNRQGPRWMARLQAGRAITMAQIRWLLLIKLVLLCWLLSSLGRSMSDGTWAGFLIRYSMLLGVTLVGVYGLVLLVHCFVRRLMGPYYPEVKRLEQSATLPIRHRRWSDTRLFRVGDTEFADRFEPVYDQVSQRFEVLTGNPVGNTRLLAICFERQRDMRCFLGRRIWLPGLYTGQKRYRVMAFCQETADDQLASIEDTILGLAAYHLTERTYGKLLPGWLSMVLQSQLLDQTHETVIAAASRRLVGCGEQLRESCLDYLQRRQVHQSMRDILRYDQSDAFRRTTQRADMGLTMGHFLFHHLRFDARDHLPQMLKSADVPVDEVFDDQFGCSLEEMVDDWRLWLGSLAGAPARGPTKRQHDRIESDLLPALCDTSRDASERARIARTLGKAGIHTCVPQLVQVLGENESSSTLQADAHWSLRAIAGRDLGGTPQPWLSWYRELPASQREPVVETVDELIHANSPAMESIDISGATEQPPNFVVSFCLKLMAVGGLTAILVSVAMLLISGWFLNPLHYLGIAVGCFAIMRAAANRWRKIQSTSIYLTANILNADVISFSIGLFLLLLMRFGGGPRARTT